MGCFQKISSTLKLGLDLTTLGTGGELSMAEDREPLSLGKK